MKTDKVIDGVLIKATQPEPGKPYIWPEGVAAIGKRAFQQWRTFNHPFHIPEGVTFIGYGAFANWHAFNSCFTLPETLSEIRAFAFGYWLNFNQPFEIPEGVTAIATQTFVNWTRFNKAFTIPGTVTSIDVGAFSGWREFNRSFYVPGSVKQIRASAFARWESFNSCFIIEGGIPDISRGAFDGWSSFKPYRGAVSGKAEKDDALLLPPLSTPGVMQDAVIGDMFVLRNGVEVLFTEHAYAHEPKFILTTLDDAKTTVTVNVNGNCISDKVISDYDVLESMASFHYKPQPAEISNRAVGSTFLLRCGHTARLTDVIDGDPPRYRLSLGNTHRTKLTYPGTGCWKDPDHPHPLDVVKFLQYRPYQ